MNYEHIANATDDRLASLLDMMANDKKALAQEVNSEELRASFREDFEILNEASRRLRARKRVPFNNEQFE